MLRTRTKWVKSNATSCADDLSDAEGFIEPTSRILTKIGEGEFQDVVTFTKSSKGVELSLCWKFTSGSFFKLDDIHLNPVVDR